ncbi:ATP-binding protein [Streptomyces sp. NPDC050392]|uniref:ATP-binding protein n=1 Tax=Streptomyces sp. NPDC050392 TaxID=3155782 RepID=UPI0034185542
MGGESSLTLKKDHNRSLEPIYDLDHKEGLSGGCKSMPSITSFEIAGLAGRQGVVRHSLEPDVNVFWGPNGSGKTSMLKILHSALQDEASTLVRVRFDWAVVRIEVRGRTIERRIRNPKAKNVNIEPTETLFDDYELHDRQVGERLINRAEKMRWSTKPSDLDDQIFRHSYLSILRLSDSPRMRVGSTADILDEVAYDRMFARQIQAIWQDYNTRELMQIRRAQQNGLAAVAGSVITRSISPRKKRSTLADIDVEAAYFAVKAFFQDQNLHPRVGDYQSFSENFLTNELMREVVAEIVEVQKEVESAQEPKRAVERLIHELFRGRMKVDFEGRFLKIKQGSDEVPLEALSSGQKQVMRLLVECLAAGPNCVIVDEPEISMHVDWQHRLVNAMRTINPKAQLILATHSPEIMADLQDRMIHEL